MARKKYNIHNDKDLCGRLFMLFPWASDSEIAEKLGSIRQVVQGWRSGKSRPTFDHISKVCEVANVDWDWLMTGKTDNVRALVNAYSAYIEDCIIDNPTFEQAKNSAKYAAYNIISARRLGVDYQEVANRLYFIATHKIDGILYSACARIGKGEKYCISPKVDDILRQSGYNDYSAGHYIIKCVLFNCTFNAPIEGVNASPVPASRPLPASGESADYLKKALGILEGPKAAVLKALLDDMAKP